MAEGTHFREDADMADVAWKLVATNLSDLAAKGAEPAGVLLSYSLGLDDRRFLEGLGEVLDRYGVRLLGGDTIRAAGPRTFGITAIGRVNHIQAPLRSGAHPGDRVYVTGVIGRAMLGFEGDPAHGDAFNRPQPLLAEGKALAPYVSAMMDVSDGLLLDCWRLATASDVAIQLDRNSIPVADPARFDECVRWGDDYQLLFTVPEGTTLPVTATCIGTVSARAGGHLRLDGEELTGFDKLGYLHH